jgi:DNA-binding GntR family transcriptional regulator
MEKRETNNQPMVINPNEFTEDMIQSLYAQIFLKYSLYSEEKKRLQKEIDNSLVRGDRIHFYAKTNQYLDFLHHYEKGILLYEQGLEFRVYFEGSNKVSM